MDYRKPKKSKEEPDKLPADNKITFDVYFQILLKAGKVAPHHKVPMRSYATQMTNLSQASLAEFDQLFRNY